MNRESLDKFCERSILGLVLAILIFTPLAFGGIAQPRTGGALDFLITNPFGVTQALVAMILFFWVLRLWVSARPQLLWPPLSWAVVAFTLYAIARYLTADI